MSARADVDGGGGTFYRGVTGKVPLDGTTPSAVMHKHLKEPLVPADHVNKELSAGVGEIIEVMMAKVRDDRYRSMEELITDIDAVAAGEPPLQAREKYDHDLLETLATGRTVDAKPADTEETTGASPRISVQWVLALGVLLAISVLCNVMLFSGL